MRKLLSRVFALVFCRWLGEHNYRPIAQGLKRCRDCGHIIDPKHESV